MQIRLSSIAQQKQKKLLEQQQKNDLIKTQEKYMGKLLAQLSQKLKFQKQLFCKQQYTNQKLKEKLTAKATLKNTLQLTLIEKKNINQELFKSVNQKKLLFQKMCLEEQRSVVKLQENQKIIQMQNIRNERKGVLFEKSQYNIDAYQKKKKELAKHIQQLCRQITKIQNVIQQFKICV